MEPLSLDWVVVASRDQVAADLETEVIVLGLQDGVYYGMDGVASRVWALVQRPAALRDVLATLLAEFDVNEATCRADLLAFVTELVQKGLVTRVRDGA